MNKYEILENIAEGEYGVVLKAHNKETDELGMWLWMQLQLKSLRRMIQNLKINGLFFVR